MSAGGFTSPFGANSNPFGSSSDARKGADSSSGMMRQVIEEDENAGPPPPPTFILKTDSGFGASFFPQDTSPDLSSPGHLQPFGEYPAQYNFARRTSVSAESLKPVADSYDNWSPPVHRKSTDQLERLKRAIQNNFLFSHLDDEQSSQILGALVEKPIPTTGIKVITQGDSGDFFYVVEKGSFDVYVNSSGSLQAGPEGLGQKVDTIMAGGSFGELALMYNAPRAATVMSAEAACTLWALDRLTFRRILMESTFARRRMYESFLEEVPLLATLTPYERSKIADALEAQKFPPGVTIIREGDPGHSFYLVESGEADAFKVGTDNPVKNYQKGDFFGELALLNDAPRAATVRARTELKVATLGKPAFQRLLGPVEGIMRRTRYTGVKTGVEDLDPLQRES
ncbi:cyclic-AMP-dependent protein kinase regulatory subunit [Grosmannia clavigera kw1407]|uniref:cAMP-dependent protein kinase regulatory subunit n=1 Tax=Grosmannia clavigera (strain kw1407 / UAMH 11150) TaxID=655863 RepID=F0XSY0_GROCL|nr:cyclic-AMP-dependent protein kinase regulatory subunit [Grosmannia clavigera kw1407]EFW99202.1 cyclic-AMP-dependent protein kinase regulatory subunit [Grosmannia clavigera kw1407]